MKVLSVNVGTPKQYNWMGQQVTTSIFKFPVEGEVHVTKLDLVGDAQAGLIFDGSGNLYGATSDGGSGGGGTVFELSPSGDSWTFKLLYSFNGPSGIECGPWGTLAMDAAGNLCGTTNCDGGYTFGSVFKLTNKGNGWLYSSLHDFSGYSDGAIPFSNVTLDTNGNLYGTAYYGGTFGGNCGNIGCGTVWMITP